MSSCNNNNNVKKLHNPKAHTPAVYIPCWLIQVPIKLISFGAKMTYGRLCQWSNSKGTVFRSSKHLAEELGVSYRSIEDYLKELREVGLIGTYHPRAGGVNHFQFYDHPWMHEPINEQLIYKSEPEYPPQNPVVPPTESCGTPPQNPVDININKIKEIKPIKKINKKSEFGIDEILKDNPFNLAQETIEDWISNRKRKRIGVTKTAWSKVNKELVKCHAANIDPLEAFETLVASGWQSLKVEYLTNKIPNAKSQASPKYDDNDTSWAKGVLL